MRVTLRLGKKGVCVATHERRRVLLHDLGDIYDAEHRFLEGQQRMVQEATDQRLRRAIQEHTEQTQQQSQNLDQAFRELGQEPRRQPCGASIGLVREAKRTTRSGRSATWSWTRATGCPARRS